MQTRMRSSAVSAACAFVAFLALGVVPSFSIEKSEYKLQPLDVITITVRGQPDLTTKTRVTTERSISFPLLGKVDVSDMTVQEFEMKLKTLLEKDYLVNAEVLVFIEEYHQKQVSVIGEVKDPGKHEMPSEKDITLMQAIAMAGGFTKDADPTDVKLIRTENGEQRTTMINTKDIAVKGEREKDIVIQHGDIISVPESSARVTVIGEVIKPDTYDMSQDKKLTLLEAIAMAGGFTKDADVKNVKLIRTENGEQKTIIIDTKDITIRGMREKDLPVQYGDIISVPQGFSRVSVIGEVNKPGTYDMPQEKSLTLLEAIAMAGGFTKHADLAKTKIMRVESGTKKTLIVNAKEITERGKKEQDVILEPDDIVFVPESFF